MTGKMDSISLQKIGKFDKRKEVVIAIPKKNKMGNLIARKLLEEATLTTNSNERGGLVPTPNPNYKVLEIPSSDIPLYVKGGVCEIGICGTDMVVETAMAGFLYEAGAKRGWNEMVAEANSFLMKLLEIGKPVRVCVVASAEMKGKPLDWLNDGLVGTTFPNMTRAFLVSQGISANCLTLGGSVEQTRLEELITAGTDQVESGRSLKKAGMADLATIIWSQYCIWANEAAYALKKALIDPFVMMCGGALSAKRDYILSGGDGNKLKESGKMRVEFNVPPESEAAIDGAIAKGDIPCGKSPTKPPLGIKGWYAYVVYVETADLMNVVPKLKELGAMDIGWQGLGGYVK